MISIFDFPKAQPLMLHEHEPVKDARYNTLPPGKDAFFLQIQDYEYKRPYAQKWQFNDPVVVIFNPTQISLLTNCVFGL